MKKLITTVIAMAVLGLAVPAQARFASTSHVKKPQLEQQAKKGGGKKAKGHKKS